MLPDFNPNCNDMLLNILSTGPCIIYNSNEIFPNHTMIFLCSIIVKAPLLLSDMAKKRIKGGITSQNNDTVLILCGR